MFRNYFKVALRNLARHKMFSFINIFGLALSMSVCLIVLIGIKHQLSYDKFHPDSDNVFRIITQLTNRNGRQWRLATTPLPLAKTLSNDYNLLDKAARIYPVGSKSAMSAEKDLHINAAFTDQEFFRIFGFTLKSGDPATVLSKPNTIVLNEETAKRYFGIADPLGKIITLDQYGEFEVKGVLAKPAGKSHIDFECLISMSSLPLLEKSGKISPISDSWNNGTSAYTYVTLKPGSNQRQLEKAVSAISALLMKETKVVGKENFDFDIQRFNDINLGEELGNNLGNTGSREKVLATIVIGFIILLSACFNYTNLSLARALKRGKEVGVRKVAGAFRLQIFYQFVIESIVIALLSLGLAMLFFQIAQRLCTIWWRTYPERFEI